MSLRKIVTWPAPILTRKCTEVTRFGEDLHELLDDLCETMVGSSGLGLAANQVGVSQRLFVMMIPDQDGENAALYEMINPVIQHRIGEQHFEESCLSFPGVSETVVRAETIEVTYHDRDGHEQARTLDGITSVCAQHELDHLDGITFLDRLSPLKHRLALRTYKRTQHRHSH